MKKRKMTLMVLLLIACLTITGCGTGLSMKGQLDYEKAAETASKALIEDKYHVAPSLETEATLIAHTIEEDKKYYIEFFYIDEEGKATNATFSEIRNTLNSNERREWFKYDLVNQFMAILEKNEKKPGQITGTIMSWYVMEGLLFQDVKYAPSVIDVDADGTWDYITNSHTVYFTDLPTEDRYPSRQVNESCTISLVSTAELIPLDQQNGQEINFESYLEPQA